MWTAVENGLPPIGKTVLVCLRSGYDGSARYHFGGRVDDNEEGWLWGVGNMFCIGIDPDGDATKNDIDADDDYQVTHWQELPASPYK